MSEPDGVEGRATTLGASARASVLWGGGFTLIRDLLQFVTMLVLVRLLSPGDYGSATLAQTILGLLAVFSLVTFSLHALQARDPAEIDWQVHFTAAVVINSVLVLVTLTLAGLLSLTSRYEAAALPLAALSLVFVVEIPAALRIRMLQVAHDWRRFRIVLITGGLLSNSTGIVIAFLGGGVWALVVQPVLAGLPAALDLILVAKWRPHLTWSWARYRATARFGAMRVASGLLLNGRQTVEQSMLAGTYDFAVLGVFTRALGLAMLVAGRLGGLAMGSLYPVITRAERGSAQFRRYAALVMRGVAWATLPAAALLALTAADITTLLYGPKWSGVVPLLPLAAIAVGFSGIATAAGTLLLANDQIRECLALDVVSAVLGVVLALWLVPAGMEIYLAALAANGMVVLGLALGLLVRTGGIDRSGLVAAFLPAMVAAAAAVGAIFAVRGTVGSIGIMPVRLVVESALFCAVYLAVLRLAFERPLRELIEVAPGRNRLSAMLAFAPRMI